MFVAMIATLIVIFAFEAIFRNAVIGSAEAPPFQVTVHPDRSYDIKVNGITWLTSGSTVFIGNRKTYSTADGSLKFYARAESEGTDHFGPYLTTSVAYRTDSLAVNVSIQAYSGPNTWAAVFTQTYDNDAIQTSAGSSQKVISKFPSFQLGTPGFDLGYLAFAGDMAGYSMLSSGRFNSNTYFPTGIEGGPLVLFDNSSNALVISPMSEFMAASSSLDLTQQINWGIMGLVDKVPGEYSVSFIVYYSNQGVNQAIRSWGNYLTKLYGKNTNRRDTDPTIRYLGYWTDNGAYYYYNTEKGKNYETTILETADYINSVGIPFKYLQFDSWWYLKGKHQGTKSWTPQSDIFPDGFKYIYEMTKLSFGYHNRFWDGDTTYAKYNGGKYNFILDNVTGLSVPDDFKFWADLFQETNSWGPFILYEQDWLDKETDQNLVLQSDLFLGGRWLSQMGTAAEMYGTINIQYCMSYSRHLLHSLYIPVVTQARVSGDYHPGGHQWNIGISSIFVDAVNVAPFKDTFWTTEYQPGNPYNATEPNTRLQALIATLSTGPVGPGDGIGFINKTLLMRCCDAHGQILKPAKPVKAIDDQIKMAAFGSPYPGPIGEVYTTYTNISGFFFGIVVAADLKNDYSLTPVYAWPTVQFPSSLAFSEDDHKTLFSLSNDSPLKLGTRCTTQHFCLYYTSPLLQLDSGEKFAILGELDKWVPMSHQRFSSIQTTGTDFLVQLTVMARETVTFTFYIASQNLVKSVVCDNSKSSSPAINTVISIAKEMCTVE